MSGRGGGTRTPDSIPYEGTALPLSYTALEDPVGFEPTCRGLRIRRFPVMPRVLSSWSPGPATIRHYRVTKPAFCPLELPGLGVWRPSGESNPGLRIDSPVSWPLND